jgi:hypothetical protein
MMRKFALLFLFAIAGCNLIDTTQSTITPTDTPIAVTDATAESLADLPTQTAVAGAVTRTPFTLPTSAPTTVSVAEVLGEPEFQAIQEGQTAFALSLDGGLEGSGLTLLPPVTTFYFAQNPANLNRYVVVDTSGLLYLTDVGGGNAARIDNGPYTQFLPSGRADNNAAVDIALWSPNGQRLAFLINGNLNANDGVWYLEPGGFGPLQLLVDCPIQDFVGCNIVAEPDNYGLWESRELYWSPDSNTLLINVSLPDRGRRGLIYMPITQYDRVRDNRPPILLYDFGTWGSNGRILASGNNPDGISMVSWIRSDGSVIETVYDASANGLWLGWAVERPNGDIVTLGAQGSGNSAVAIYDINGNALTTTIGSGFPQRVEWSPERDAVLVEVNGQRYIASVNGEILDITAQTAGTVVNWIR